MDRLSFNPNPSAGAQIVHSTPLGGYSSSNTRLDGRPADAERFGDLSGADRLAISFRAPARY
jgi:hypothetical protein